MRGDPDVPAVVKLSGQAKSPSMRGFSHVYRGKSMWGKDRLPGEFRVPIGILDCKSNVQQPSTQHPAVSHLGLSLMPKK